MLLCWTIFPVSAQEVTEELLPTHLRWNIQSFRNQIIITKKPQVVILQTLDINFFNKMALSIGNIETQKDYFKKVTFSKEGYPKNPASIKIELANKGVELFTYHKHKNQILDFWINEDFIKSRRASVEKNKQSKKIFKTVVKKVKKKIVKKGKDLRTLRNSFKKTRPKGTKKYISKKYRDFRYGAAFIWDYDPVLPVLKDDLNLRRKTPEYFYSIKDRKFTKDDKEAHMQLSINLYRKSKWGLMTKSITLYEKKYGIDKNQETNYYLKANALIKKSNIVLIFFRYLFLSCKSKTNKSNFCLISCLRKRGPIDSS